MRISDWSSDVCSSDLHETSRGAAAKGGTVGFFADCRSWERTSFQGLRDVERRCRRAFQAAGAISRSDSSPRKMVIRSEEHTSELQSLMRISYAVFCLKKKNNSKRLRLRHYTTV